MKIPFVDLKAQYRSIAPEIDEAIAKVVTDCAFINGKYVKEFEKNFAQFCRARNCIGVGNGTDALFVALTSLGIGRGHEVIVPANTFVATSEAVSMTGAKVVFADCDPQSYTIDVNLIETLINSKTRAIIPVHLYGHPADLKAIKTIADNHNLKIVQDCAQAHGASIYNNTLSDFGDVLCFSFYPGKNLGAYGDAGAIVTNNDELATKMRMFANHGRISKYDHEFEGVNSRMDGIQGAVLDVKLKYLEEWTEKRISAARKYNKMLGDIKEVVTPVAQNGFRHVYHLYVSRTERRDELQSFLQKEGISTGIHYPQALPNLTAYNYLGYSSDDFPVATKYQNQILSLPIFPEITESQIGFVCEGIRKFFA